MRNVNKKSENSKNILKNKFYIYQIYIKLLLTHDR